MKETWKSVGLMPDSYNISSMGRIKRLELRANTWYGSRLVNEKILKAHVSKNGYYRIPIYINGKQVNFSIHRLVATAFIPNPDNKPTVNHKNGIKTDNRVENLEWATRSENSQHAVDNKLYVHAKPQLGKPGKLHPRSIPVGQYLNGHLIRVYESAHLASKSTGISQGSISRVCRKERRTSNGFIFEYLKQKESAKALFVK